MKAGRFFVFAYTAGIFGLGLALFLLTVLRWDQAGTAAFGWTFVLLFGYVLVGELFPLRVPRRDEIGEITLSTTFAFAILIELGTVAAMVALAVSSVIADVVHRKAWWKTAFNAAQMSLSLLAAGSTLAWLSGGTIATPVGLSRGTLPWVIVSAGVFFVTNLVFMYPLVWLDAWRSREVSGSNSVGELLLRDLPFQAITAAVLLSLSPIVAAAAQHDQALIPLFAIPMMAIYGSVQIYLEREHQVLHDGLTGLPNRVLFRDRVAQAITGAQHRRSRTAVLIIDLDNFKEVNDTFGHATGDRLLVVLAERLRTVVRPADTVARLGADEFAVAVWAVEDDSGLVDGIRAIRTVIERPVVLEGVTLAIEASVGAAVWPEHGSSPDELLRNADTAMHVAKGQRSGHRLYLPEDADRVGRRMRLIADLRTAIKHNDLELHYQPKVSLSTGAIAGVEALIRWRQDGRLVPPNDFIPAAEQTGIMGALTRYVIRDALAQVRSWHRNGIRMPVAVNVSARDLQDATLPDDIAGMLASAGVAARWLELEVTESSIMADVEAAIGVLDRLRAMGVTLAIDDFGTGNTSLAHLPRLPVQVLKIDKSFVDNLDAVGEDPIVRTTIDLGRSLGLSVVAEGVASERIWNRLEGLGCDLAQGFHVSAPLPALELESWLRRGHPSAPTGDR